MLQPLQATVERFIQGFQEHWETRTSFRTTWSLISVVVAVALVCGISGLVASSIGSIGGGSPSVQVYNFGSGGGGNSVGFPIPSYTPGGAGATPPANFVATTTAGPPTATANPTELPGTPSPTPSPTPTPGGVSINISAQQNPNPWQATKPNNTLSNFSTNPQQPGAFVILISLSFSSDGTCTVGSAQQPIAQFTLDANGNYAQTVQMGQFPACAEALALASPTPIPVTASYQIGGNNVQEQYNLKK